MKRFWFFFIDHFRFTYVIIGTIFLLGLVSILSMPKESSPEVVIPVGVVSTVYPGASALDVEELITREIEKEIEDLDDVSTFSSTSSEGISMITVEFDAASDIDDRIRALKDAVDEATPKIPQEAERPVVNQISFEDEPIMVMAVSLEADDLELKQIGEKVQDELEQIPGLTEAKVVGIRDREIQVIVQRAQLDHYELSLQDIVSAFQKQDVQLPVGSIEQKDRKYTVRLEGGLKENLSLLSEIPLQTRGNQPLLLRDVADVVDGFEEKSSLSRLSIDGKKAKSSLSIEIFKRQGKDIITLVDAVQEKLEKLKKNELKGAEVVISYNEGERIREDLRNLLWNGFQTILLVFLLLSFFLGFREALLAGISIPFTFMMSFIGLSLLGFTINFLTLFSLILSLGILVDAAIVMVEGMHMHLNTGKSAKEAAKATIDEFQWPVISGIMTSVSAFIPMMLSSGITGQFIRTIPVTVITVLLSSLFVALAIITVIGSRTLKHSSTIPSSQDDYLSKISFIDHLSKKYKEWIPGLLTNKQRQKKWMVRLVIAFVISVSLPFIGILDAVLFPPYDDDRFIITLTAPVGTVLSKTNELAQEVESILYQDERITSFLTTVGSSSGQSVGSGGQSNEHIARFSVNLLDQEERDIPSYEIVDEYRQRLIQVSGAEISISQNEAGPPTGAPIEITFFGPDLDELDRLLQEGEQLLTTIPGVTGVETSTEETPLEFAFQVNRSKAAQLGLTPQDIASFLRTAVFGTTATSLKISGDDIDVVVKLDLNLNQQRDPHATSEVSIDVLERINIPSPQGLVPLSALVETKLQSGRNSIPHEEGERISRLTAYTKPGFTTVDVTSAFQEEAKKWQLKDQYRIEYGGESEDVEQSFTDLYNAMIIAVFLILAILVLQFNSFRQPFFIMASLPFALIGVLPGLALTQQPLSFPAFIGIVALIGIVVNDAIILMDQINRNRHANLPFIEAIVSAGVSRLQPIILTTLTTVAGILPLTLSDPTWGPLGFSIIFGLLFSTVLTLIIVPMLYSRYAKKEETIN